MDVMPEKRTLERARAARRAGKAPSTQAGEYVREEMEHIRQGKHGARSAKQAIAIGLSKARRAGVPLKPKRNTKAETRAKARRDLQRGRASSASSRPSPRRSRATRGALEREARSAASRRALSKNGRNAAKARTPSARSAAAKKAARTKTPAARRAAGRKAATTKAERKQRERAG
jgi:hypothetical protein